MKKANTGSIGLQDRIVSVAAAAVRLPVVRGTVAGVLALAVAAVLALSLGVGGEPTVVTRTETNTRVVQPMDYVAILQGYYRQIDDLTRRMNHAGTSS